LRFEAIASSSHGNAYLVEDGQTRILLECGLAFRTLQKKLGFSLAELDGVLVTHEHKDHARCASEMVHDGQTVYMSAGTAVELGLAEERQLESVYGEQCSPLHNAVAVISEPGVEMVEDREQFRVGSFDVVAFATYHDAAEPLGFVIRSRADGDVLVFATDTVNLRYRFPGLRLLAVEANYQESILERSQRLPDKTKARIRNTHMEIDTLCDILKGMDLRKCREIWLLHLSDAMSHEGQFIHKVERVVPPWVTVRAAGR
jgi:phosphoribosyl 1,2-cyclic phosphodiesterase